jgi:hypothetical protein
MDKLISLGFYGKDRTFKILRKPEEIVAAYENGPTSCMNDPEEYPYVSCKHPAYVYGSPDLGLAVIMAGDKCVARSVCWPDKKIYTRIYGHSKLLRAELEKQGFRQTSAVTAWEGARLLKIYDQYEGAYVCPYLDMGNYVSEARDEKYLRIRQRGQYSAHECYGLVGEV